MGKNEIIKEFITELLKTAPDDYMEIKLILLSCNSGKPELTNFLRKVFSLVDEKQPLLIEMKGWGAA